MYNPRSYEQITFFDLVIFDCDGVLVNSEPLANQVYVHMLEEYGHQVNTEQYLREFSGASISKRLEVTIAEIELDSALKFPSIFNERLSRSAMKRNSSLSLAFMRSLKVCHVPICVASNGSREEIMLRLKIAQLTEHFGKMRSSADWKCRIPSLRLMFSLPRPKRSTYPLPDAL